MANKKKKPPGKKTGHLKGESWGEKGIKLKREGVKTGKEGLAKKTLKRGKRP